MWVLATLTENQFLTKDFNLVTDLSKAKEFASYAEAYTWYNQSNRAIRTPIKPLDLEKQ